MKYFKTYDSKLLYKFNPETKMCWYWYPELNRWILSNYNYNELRCYKRLTEQEAFIEIL